MRRLIFISFMVMSILAHSETPPPSNLVNWFNAPVSYPTDQALYDLYPWSVTYFYGWTVKDPLVSIVKPWRLTRWPEEIQSIEAYRTLSPDNFLRCLLRPLVGIVQFGANFTVRNGDNENTIYEFDPYLAFRWANFPWNDYLTTSFALGEGVSYASSYPWLEKRTNSNTKRFLNYLMLEATFALPRYPRLQVIARVHHRSGAYGLYRAGNTGSNAFGIGLRYLFA